MHERAHGLDDPAQRRRLDTLEDVCLDPSRADSEHVGGCAVLSQPSLQLQGEERVCQLTTRVRCVPARPPHAHAMSLRRYAPASSCTRVITQWLAPSLSHNSVPDRCPKPLVDKGLQAPVWYAIPARPGGSCRKRGKGVGGGQGAPVGRGVLDAKVGRDCQCASAVGLRAHHHYTTMR